MRVDFDPEIMGGAAFYRFLTSVVIPRPIAWVSTVTSDGSTENLAPHSFFSIASTDPPIVQFTSIGRKDSLRNVEDGERVRLRGDRPRTEPVRTAAQGGGLPVVLECRSHTTLRMGNSTLVFGRVLHAAVAEDCMGEDRPSSERLLPLTKLGGDEWGTLGKVLHLSRIPYEEPGP